MSLFGAVDAIKPKEPEPADPEDKSLLARRAVIYCDAWRRVLLLEYKLNGYQVPTLVL